MTTPPREGFGFGSLPASISRLRASRNRLAGLISQTLLDEARDCNHWRSANPELVHERTILERARETLLTSPPLTESNDERSWRVGAREDFARLEGERTHGEPYATERSPNVH